jgi:hypothetical protein
MSNADVPSVQTRPIWPAPTTGWPERNRRVCVPLVVPGTADHDDQLLPLYLV